MEKKGFRLASGLFGFLASLLLVVYVFEATHGILQAVLYTAFAFLAYSLASYLLLSSSANKIVRIIPFVYLGAGLAMVYTVVVLAGGHNMFLYLAATTAAIAAISYLYATYATNYHRNVSKLGLKTH
ncbi:MAG: hypothetical protein M0Z77_02500 [Thermoplasmatales archaeon]|nr:hypothetical protein [Candidatus Thermoplasmatota archaeon]MCL6003200.1 hypothetical protein [Candidatus Thermoplasmatota archaeon]MDA8054507.1 hypothetical protein [Thermoplasmatales archaeon]